MRCSTSQWNCIPARISARVSYIYSGSNKFIAHLKSKHPQESTIEQLTIWTLFHYVFYRQTYMIIVFYTIFVTLLCKSKCSDAFRFKKLKAGAISFRRKLSSCCEFYINFSSLEFQFFSTRRVFCTKSAEIQSLANLKNVSHPNKKKCWSMCTKFRKSWIFSTANQFLQRDLTVSGNWFLHKWMVFTVSYLHHLGTSVPKKLIGLHCNTEACKITCKCR